MRRLAALALGLLCTGCFSASGGVSGDGAIGNPGEDGPTIEVDGAPLTDGSLAPPGPCVVDTELCGIESSLGEQESGWSSVSVPGMCEVRFADNTLILDANDPTCPAGSACVLSSPQRPMGTARVVARSVNFSARPGGALTFSIVADADNFLRFQFGDGDTGVALSVKAGAPSASTPFVFDDATWYSIRVTAAKQAVYEVWDGAAWQVVGRGPSPFLPDAPVRLQLGMECLSATSGDLEAVWGEVGGKE